jgi:hypothetical protein
VNKESPKKASEVIREDSKEFDSGSSSSKQIVENQSMHHFPRLQEVTPCLDEWQKEFISEITSLKGDDKKRSRGNPTRIRTSDNLFKQINNLGDLRKRASMKKIASERSGTVNFGRNMSISISKLGSTIGPESEQALNLPIKMKKAHTEKTSKQVISLPEEENQTENLRYSPKLSFSANKIRNQVILDP